MLLPKNGAPARPRQVSVAGRVFQVDIRRHAGARRYTLRMAAAEVLRLTVPRGASVSDGLRFVEGQAGWIRRERERQAARYAPWRHGAAIWYRGEQVAIDVSGDGVSFGAAAVAADAVGADVRVRVEAHLRAAAARELPPRCRDLANRWQLRVASVRVRNQQSRWGACSARGAITLNWRLIQMPTSVADYVMLHELMHLRQPNHSRKFWREVAGVCPEWRDAERWLKTWGRTLL